MKFIKIIGAFFISCSAAISQPVTIPDQNLDQAIRETLNRESGELTNADLAKLTRLRAVGKSIADLTGLSHAVNLNTLILGANKINDLKPISGLTKLEYLYIWNNGIEDVMPLQNLLQLKSLDLGANNVSDFSFLKSLTQLHALDASGNTIDEDDLNIIGSLSTLRWLSLMQNSISDVCPLRELNLERLFLSNNQIVSTECLSKMSNLVWLKLDTNELSDITPLMSLGSLMNIELQNNYLDFGPEAENLKWVKSLSSKSNFIFYQPQNMYSLFQKNPPHLINKK